MHDFNWHWGGMHFLWWIVLIAILVLIFVIPGGISYRKRKEEEPLDILKKRFAKGEISKEEYEESRKALDSKG